jgi:hypothetical protein
LLRQNVSSKLSSVLNVVGAFSSFLVIFIGATLKLDPAKHVPSETAKGVLGFSQDWAWLSIPVFAILAAISQTTRARIGSTSTWATVNYLLEEYRNALFDKHPTAKDDPEYYHRVTLFKYVGWRWALALWPWNGWMVPVARTGHVTKSRRIPRFRVSMHDPDKAQGVAGQTFVRNKMIPVFGLPEITPTSGDADLEKYSNKAFVSIEWLRKRQNGRNFRPLSQSLLGIPVEVGGEPWGVLVVDSRSDMEISRKSALKTAKFQTLTDVLGKLLQSPKAHRK